LAHSLPSHHCREHATKLLQVAIEVKGCCEAVAAVLRNNAPVQPALQQLERLEQAFWQLQQAVGHLGPPEPVQFAEADAADVMAAMAAKGSQSRTSSDLGATYGAAREGSAAAQDSLAVHLTLTMLFTCCTRVSGESLVAGRMPASTWRPKQPAWQLEPVAHAS
jgi:hypothetical protein